MRKQGPGAQCAVSSVRRDARGPLCIMSCLTGMFARITCFAMRNCASCRIIIIIVVVIIIIIIIICIFINIIIIIIVVIMYVVVIIKQEAECKSCALAA